MHNFPSIRWREIPLFQRRFDGSENAISLPSRLMSANAIGRYLPFASEMKPRIVERAPHRERRATVRTSVHWPVLFRHTQHEMIESVTQNLSSQGFYCFSQMPVASGESMLCSLTVPTHDPSGSSERVILECNVRVVRLEEPTSDGLYGLACRIEDYRLAAAESTRFLS
jgi:hypothetical protein